MTIQRLVDIFADERKDAHVTEEKVRGYVKELEAKLCTEIFATHESPPPGAFLYGGMPPPPARMWKPGDWPPPTPPQTAAEHGLNDELLVLPPYDDIYRAYIQWRVDMKQNDTYDASNSQRLYWQAYQDFSKFWNRTHMPINKTPYAGYKE